MLPPPTLPAIAHGQPVCVAFSGGLDSTTLLHVLADAPAPHARGLRALHIHHGLHAGADHWAEHCARICHGLRIELDVLRVEVDRASGLGLEAAARAARYRALSGALRPGEVLVTAHHLDDQAETFLLRALRGSGVEGLAAMTPWRSFARGWHWRPWLQVPRARILAHAQARGLQWIEDPSNHDTDLDRNFLRQQVMPLLARRWPQAAASFARSAQLSQQAVALLEGEDEAALAAVGTDQPTALSVAALRTQAPARRARVLRRWIAGLGLPPLPAQGVERIESDLLQARHDAQPAFEWSGVRIVRWRDRLYAHRPRPGLLRGWQTEWDGRLPLVLPGGDILSLEGAVAFPAVVRVAARRGGERLRRPGRDHTHALKHVLQDRGMPPWERAQLPLLFDPTGSLLAAGDVVIGDTLDHWLRQHHATLRWNRGGD